MKKMLDRLERLFTAITFAEAGERDAARKMLEQRGRRAEVHRFASYRRTEAYPGRPGRRAA